MKMIEIIIKANGEKVLDHLKKRKTTLGEVSLALFRLKQIEKEVIDIKFDDDINISQSE